MLYETELQVVFAALGQPSLLLRCWRGFLLSGGCRLHALVYTSNGRQLKPNEPHTEVPKNSELDFPGDVHVLITTRGIQGACPVLPSRIFLAPRVATMYHSNPMIVTKQGPFCHKY